MSELKLISPERALVEAVDEALREHSLGVLRFLELEAERKGWRCSYRQQRQMYLHWLDPEQPNEMPAASLVNVIRVVGHARFVDVLLAVESRVQRERRSINGASHEARESRSRR